MPQISVVMPVLNGEKYLKEAIESILNQSYRDFEFIIINDGSTDSTEEIIQSFSDERIVCINNSTNFGLAKSFNIGIRAARGHYIARMDADDVSIPERFEQQMGFLTKHPEIGIVGSAVTIINESGRRVVLAHKPLTHLALKWQSLSSTPLFHPTILARSEVLKNNLFDESLHNSEDYELWSRLIFEKGIKMANLAEPQLLYRVSKESFTQTLDKNRKLATVNNIVKNIERYTSLPEIDKDLILKYQSGEVLSFSQLKSIYDLYNRAAREFQEREHFSPNLFPILLSLVKYKIKQYTGKL